MYQKGYMERVWDAYERRGPLIRLLIGLIVLAMPVYLPLIWPTVTAVYLSWSLWMNVLLLRIDYVHQGWKRDGGT